MQPWPQNGETDTAIVHFKESIRLDPKMWPALVKLAEALPGQGPGGRSAGVLA